MNRQYTTQAERERTRDVRLDNIEEQLGQSK